MGLISVYFSRQTIYTQNFAKNTDKLYLLLLPLQLPLPLSSEVLIFTSIIIIIM